MAPTMYSQELERRSLPRKSLQKTRFRVSSHTAIRHFKNKNFTLNGQHVLGMNNKFCLVKYPEGLDALILLKDFIAQQGEEQIIHALIQHCIQDM